MIRLPIIVHIYKLKHHCVFCITLYVFAVVLVTIFYFLLSTVFTAVPSTKIILPSSSSSLYISFGPCCRSATFCHFCSTASIFNAMIHVFFSTCLPVLPSCSIETYYSSPTYSVASTVLLSVHIKSQAGPRTAIS